jgi:hypothetical protein
MYAMTRIHTWDWDINSNLSGLNILLECLCRCSGLCEDSHTVTILVGVDEINGAIQGVDLKGYQDWTEDLLLVALHVWLDACDDSWSHPVT